MVESVAEKITKLKQVITDHSEAKKLLMPLKQKVENLSYTRSMLLAVYTNNTNVMKLILSNLTNTA